jgi:hypothetical protein
MYDPHAMLTLANSHQEELRAEAHRGRLAKAARQHGTPAIGELRSAASFRRRITIGAAGMVVTFGLIVAAAVAAI